MARVGRFLSDLPDFFALHADHVENRLALIPLLPHQAASFRTAGGDVSEALFGEELLFFGRKDKRFAGILVKKGNIFESRLGGGVWSHILFIPRRTG